MDVTLFIGKLAFHVAKFIISIFCFFPLFIYTNIAYCHCLRHPRSFTASFISLRLTSLLTNPYILLSLFSHYLSNPDLLFISQYCQLVQSLSTMCLCYSNRCMIWLHLLRKKILLLFSSEYYSLESIKPNNKQKYSWESMSSSRIIFCSFLIYVNLSIKFDSHISSNT